MDPMSITWVVGNWRTKIIAAAVAASFWAAVAYAQNPTESRAITVRAQHTPLPPGIVLVEALPLVTVRVVGSQESLRTFNPASLRAIADVSHLGKGANRVPLTMERPVDRSVQVEDAPQYITVVGDELGSLTLPLAVRTAGNPADGYRIVEHKPKPEEVVAVGPKSLLEGLSAYLTVELTDRRTSIPERLYPVQLEGKNRRPPENVAPTPKEASVSIVIEAVTVTVSKVVGFSLTGRQADGYRVDSAYVDPAQVNITGGQALVDPITQLTTDPVDISRATGEVVRQVALSLPAGVKANRSTVTVHVLISRLPVPPPIPLPTPTPVPTPTPSPR